MDSMSIGNEALAKADSKRCTKITSIRAACPEKSENVVCITQARIGCISARGIATNTTQTKISISSRSGGAKDT